MPWRLPPWGTVIRPAGPAVLAVLALAMQASAALSDAPAASGPALRPFVDPLFIPPVLSPKADAKGVPTLEIIERRVEHRFHRDLPPTQVWAYQGTVPGPTVRAERGQALKVRWLNRLPAAELLPARLPQSLPGDCGPQPEGRSVAHLHGALVREGNFMDAGRNSDGYPEAYILPGQVQSAFYPNVQPAACLWYHDHALGATARDVAAGLAGFYLLRDPGEAALGLPSGAQELPLMLQARAFNSDGSLRWPGLAASEEAYGDQATVNGTVQPYCAVEARRYRLRLLNASTSRILSLRLRSRSGEPGPALVQVGSDQGLLERPIPLAESGVPGFPDLVLGPGERADVVVDFSGRPGAQWILANSSLTDVAGGEEPLPFWMLFRVGRRPAGGDPSRVPPSLEPAEAWPEASGERNIFFSSQSRDHEPARMLLNSLPWGAPVEERVLAGCVERWNLVNTTREWHSFHIHAAALKVLERRELDMGGDGAAATAAGHRHQALACEGGVKDTVLLPPLQLTVVLIRFGPFPGRYVFHCHMLEHEDDDMMRPYDVLPSPRSVPVSQAFDY